MPDYLGSSTTPMRIDVMGITSQPIHETGSSNAVITSVNSAILSTQLLAANPNRKGFAIFNNSTKLLYIKFGLLATPISFTARIPPTSLYESTKPIYTGVVEGVWSALNGSASITELT